MKVGIFLAAVALSVLGATAASAQVNNNTVVQEGSRNYSNTRQQGYQNNNEVAQFGSKNNTANVQQRGQYNNNAIGQVGLNPGDAPRNRANVDQRGPNAPFIERARRRNH